MERVRHTYRRDESNKFFVGLRKELAPASAVSSIESLSLYEIWRRVLVIDLDVQKLAEFFMSRRKVSS